MWYCITFIDLADDIQHKDILANGSQDAVTKAYEKYKIKRIIEVELI